MGSWLAEVPAKGPETLGGQREGAGRDWQKILGRAVGVMVYSNVCCCMLAKVVCVGVCLCMLL